jgi:polysaccharide deacetylase family sporulation protein PdaB
MSIFVISAIAVISIIFAASRAFRSLSVYLNNENSMPICCVDIPDKRAALTFDAAWGDEYIPDILDTLKRYNVKGTFFVVGTWAERYPDILTNMNDNGNEIGNHSMTHVRMTGLSKSSIRTEIDDSSEIIKSITGKQTVLFRAPFGEYDSRLINETVKAKHHVIQWDVDSMDWKGIESREIYELVVNKTGNGSIVLFHCNAENTLKALPDIIESLRNEGFQFVTVSELIFKDNYFIDNTGRQKLLK